jgi:YVTN family beta-propeller protein
VKLIQTSKNFLCLLIVFSVFSFQSKTSFAQTADRILPGKKGDYTLLPNGWKLTPEGRQIPTGDLPLNMELSKDGRYLLVTTNGNGDQTIKVIDTFTKKSLQTIKVKKSWLGLAFAPDGKRFFVSGGDDNEILVFDFKAGVAIQSGKIILGSKEYHLLDDKGRNALRDKGKGEYAFPAGLAVSGDGRKLYVAENLTNKLAVVDLVKHTVITKIAVGEFPYDCVLSKDNKRVYVSNWGERSVSVVDALSQKSIGTIQVGDHPNDLELTRDGKILYVANANSNTVSIVDTSTMKEIEAISTALHPKSPIGSTPNAVALSQNEQTLFIANADNNNIAIVDVSKNGDSKIKGFIPTGWYPTSVRLSKDGRKIFVANGKGIVSKANPKGPIPGKRNPNEEYIGRILTGTVSIINNPVNGKLEQLTKKVYANSPYTDEFLKASLPPKEPTAIPFRLGEPSPIKHVIYVIKENRTYDQVLGDMKEGNGDVSLCLFGESVTPNQHALAREFVLLDNFYVDAEVSADGHNWSMGAYATDYVEKTWPTEYSSRGRKYDFEDGGIAQPTKGYIWDYCQRAGITYRSYGEFIETREGKPGGGGDTGGDPTGGKPKRENYTLQKALEGHFCPTFVGWDMNTPDNERIDEWLKEFREYEKNGQLPQFQIVRIGGDHTQGARIGAPTPRAHVAENDLALGRLVEAVSNSKYWADTAIFVLEDDAQNGPDHVDAHRSIAFIASAYTKRGVVDSTMYTTSSMLRTMELILGLPPMSQYDAAAIPMFNSFTNKPDMTPFKARPATYPLDEKNKSQTRSAMLSETFDFTKVDAAPDIAFNEVIWKTVHGEDSVMPAPVRSAFVRVIDDDDDDEFVKKRKRKKK